jgi:hypothetical protein
MRWLRAALTAALLTSCGGDTPLRPGDEVAGVRLVRGAAEDVSLWDFCTPSLEGAVRRSCRVPPVDRLRIGPGWRSGSPSALGSEWDELEWDVRLDGRPLDLEAFGTLPDTRLRNVVVREWNVAVEGLHPASHRLRAVVRSPGRRYEVTWVIRVGART